MADNKLFDFMNVELPEPKRSNIPWREVNRTTFSPGYANVSFVSEVLPGDRWSGNLHTIVRSRPTISSIYGSFRESHQAFFVPTRLYSKVMDQLQTFGNSVEQFNPSVDIPFPCLDWSFRGDEMQSGVIHSFVPPGSLLNQLHMFPSMFNTDNAYYIDDELGVYKGSSFNAIPLLAYYDILRNYYYNAQELEMPFVSNEQFSSRDGVTYNLVSKSSLDKLISDAYEGVYNQNSFLAEDLLSIGIPLFSPDLGYNFSSFSNVISYVADGELERFVNHAGLGLRSYDDDYFVTSLNNEYVDDLNNTARVVVSNGSFSVSQMQRANRLHKHISRNILCGNDYEDYLYVHFNVKLGREVNKPVFLGSVSNDFYFEDIYSTYPSSGGTDFPSNTLGQRAGILNSKNSSSGFIDFTANEYGYIIVISSLIPKVSYSKGIPKMYLKTSSAHLYAPEFDAWSFQDVHPLEFNGNIDYNLRDNVVKSQPAWFEHLATYDKHSGLFATDLQYNFQILGRDSDNLEDLYSSYVKPWEWNYIFQYQESWFDNFEVQLLFDFNIYRPISKQILPTIN